MRKKNRARHAKPARRKARPRRSAAVPQPVGSGLHFDHATIVAGAEYMLRNGCTYNEAALASAAVYNAPVMTPAERATWRETIRNGLHAATAAQDQVFRQRLRACGERLIHAHPDLTPEIQTAWRAFAADWAGPSGIAVVAPLEGAPPSAVFPLGLPAVVDLVAVMTASWHRLRRMVEEDPDWYNRACISPAGRH